MNSFLRKYGKGIFELVAILLISYQLAGFFQPHINNDALDVLVNIYSILAGFLVGVIALIGDPSTLPSGSWTVAEASLRNTLKRLKGTRNLLYVYLITLFLIFVYKMTSVEFGIEVLNKFGVSEGAEELVQDLKKKSEFYILFFAFVALFYSFKLPAKLFAIQKFRVDEEVERRRKQENIKN